MSELVTDSIKHTFDERGNSVFAVLEVGISQLQAEPTVLDEGRGGEASVMASEAAGACLLAA